jgi:uncharacterized protein (UPF0128 family)
MIFLFNGCDYVSITEIVIENKSSYDLYIEFVVKESIKIDLEKWDQGYNNIEINRGESISIEKDGFNDGSVRNPNNEIIKIIFSKSYTKEILKEIDNNKNIFREKYYQNSYASGSAGYELIIDDDLLL